MVEKSKNSPSELLFIVATLAAVISGGRAISSCTDSAAKRDAIKNGPFMGGVAVTDAKGEVIPQDRLAVAQIRDFLKRSLEKAKAKTQSLLKDVTTPGPDTDPNPEIVKFEQGFETGMDEAIRQVTIGDFDKALSAVESALKVPPTINIGPSMPEFTLDVQAFTARVQEVIEPLAEVHKALEWLVVTRGKSSPAQEHSR